MFSESQAFVSSKSFFLVKGFKAHLLVTCAYLLLVGGHSTCPCRSALLSDGDLRRLRGAQGIISFKEDCLHVFGLVVSDGPDYRLYYVDFLVLDGSDYNSYEHLQRNFHCLPCRLLADISLTL